MRIHVATLFNCDSDSRILSLRRPWSRPGGPPRFFMGRTHGNNVWLFRHDMPDCLTHEIEDLCLSEPAAKRLIGPRSIATEVRAALQSRAPITREYRGPAYLIPE